MRIKASNGVLFIAMCRAHGLPDPVAELRFEPTRRWKFDWAWPVQGVALEVEGGAWTRGRHTRGKGFVSDIEKYNAATLAGWRLLRCVPDDVQSGAVFDVLKRAMKGTNP